MKINIKRNDLATLVKLKALPHDSFYNWNLFLCILYCQSWLLLSVLRTYNILQSIKLSIVIQFEKKSREKRLEKWEKWHKQHRFGRLYLILFITKSNDVWKSLFVLVPNMTEIFRKMTKTVIIDFQEYAYQNLCQMCSNFCHLEYQKHAQFNFSLKEININCS